MAHVIAGMTQSLDGFIEDAAGSADALYTDLTSLHGTDYMQSMIEETGAVLMGRRSFEMGDPDWYAGNYEFQVPIFVVTHEPPSAMPKQDDNLTFTFVTDGIESALEQAMKAAAGKAVLLAGGANIAQQYLAARRIDEINLALVPLLLRSGARLFDNLGEAELGLEQVRAIDAPGVTHLKYRGLK